MPFEDQRTGQEILHRLLLQVVSILNQGIVVPLVELPSSLEAMLLM